MQTDAYLEAKVLSADAVGLIGILYDTALDSVRSAIEHLAAGNTRARCEAISKALDIVGLLSVSLNRKAGGEISRNLEGLYRYVEDRLVEANLRQERGPLEEVAKLLSTLAEGWRGASAAILPLHPGEPEQAPSQEPFTGVSAWEGMLHQDVTCQTQQQAWSF